MQNNHEGTKVILVYRAVFHKVSPVDKQINDTGKQEANYEKD